MLVQVDARQSGTIAAPYNTGATYLEAPSAHRNLFAQRAAVANATAACRDGNARFSKPVTPAPDRS